MQLSLFEHVKSAYGETEKPLNNETLYSRVAQKVGLTRDELAAKSPVGEEGAQRSKLERQIRWHQQTMKIAGWLEKTDTRGIWQLTKVGKTVLSRADSKVALIAFSTNLGVAIWGDCSKVFSSINEPIALCVTSPPYPLRQARAYGNVDAQQYIDFICTGLEPVAKHLKPGGSITLNVSNDIFENGSPARSLYLEKLTIAICERLGLFLMDRLIWVCPNKAPGPTYWASIKRVQLNVGYEPVLWFTNDPSLVQSNNNRVLEPHTEKHLALISNGGERRHGNYSDGAHKIHPGDFGNPTLGRIPKNTLTIANTCQSQRDYKKTARNLGLPTHGAPMPLKLATFLIQFLTNEDDLCVDPYGGSFTTALAAESIGRRWVSSELYWEYLRGAAERFRQFGSLHINPSFCEH